jgi:very-short-patch-repair endonuclease
VKEKEGALGEKRLTKRARTLRRDMTEAERKLWTRIRNRQLERTKFVKQSPIGPYIADFAARSLKLVIELDGGQHNEAKDAARTKLIEAHGYRVIRFWNNDVMENIDGVLETIANEILIARGE